MAHDVFISYSTKDKAIANKVCASIESEKIRCYIAPRDISPGRTWAGSLTEAISDSRIMILIFTENSNRSNQILKEIEVAFKKNITILPFKTGDFELSNDMEYYLSNIHWLDLEIPEIDSQIEMLIEKVKAILSAYHSIDNKKTTYKTESSTNENENIRFNEPPLSSSTASNINTEARSSNNDAPNQEFEKGTSFVKAIPFKKIIAYGVATTVAPKFISSFSSKLKTKLQDHANSDSTKNTPK